MHRLAAHTRLFLVCLVVVVVVQLRGQRHNGCTLASAVDRKQPKLWWQALRREFEQRIRTVRVSGGLPPWRMVVVERVRRRVVRHWSARTHVGDC
jgi:hypothetical protein